MCISLLEECGDTHPIRGVWVEEEIILAFLLLPPSENLESFSQEQFFWTRSETHCKPEN
jgi:hypothetical protein